MLPRLVPCADQQHEARRDAALERALQRAKDNEVGEVLGEADAEDDDAPADHVDREGAAHFVALEDDVAWEFEAHVCDVCIVKGVLLG